MKIEYIFKSYNFIFDEVHKCISEIAKIILLTILKYLKSLLNKVGNLIYFNFIKSKAGRTFEKGIITSNSKQHKFRTNEKSIPYLNVAQFNRLLFLRIGVALIVGASFSIPMEVKIDGEIL